MKKALCAATAVCLLFSCIVGIRALAQGGNGTVDEGSAGDKVYYQTMGYCYGKLTYKCTLVETSERCRISACKTDY